MLTYVYFGTNNLGRAIAFYNAHRSAWGAVSPVIRTGIALRLDGEYTRMAELARAACFHGQR
jgi:hypothetical protein